MQGFCELAVNALETLFKFIWMKIFLTDHIYEVTNLTDLHVHDKVL